MVNGNFVKAHRRNIIGGLAAASIALGLTGCSIVKDEPGQIKYPDGAEIEKGDNKDQVVIISSRIAADAIDCGRVDKSILGFRLPTELGGRKVKREGPVDSKTARPGQFETTCTDDSIAQFTEVPVKVFLQTITVEEPKK